MSMSYAPGPLLPQPTKAQRLRRNGVACFIGIAGTFLTLLFLGVLIGLKMISASMEQPLIVVGNIGIGAFYLMGVYHYLKAKGVEVAGGMGLAVVFFMAANWLFDSPVPGGWLIGLLLAASLPIYLALRKDSEIAG